MMKIFIKGSSTNVRTVVKNYVTKKDLQGTLGQLMKKLDTIVISVITRQSQKTTS